MGTEGIKTNCINLRQFYFLDDSTGDPIDGTFAAGSFITEEVETNHDGNFQIQIGASAGASGEITLQQSADLIFWDDLPNSTSVLPIRRCATSRNCWNEAFSSKTRAAAEAPATDWLISMRHDGWVDQRSDSFFGLKI